jgi:hypothetical protein
LLLSAGESVSVVGISQGFRKVKILRGNKWRVGYIPLEPESLPSQVEWEFAAGAGFAMTRLTQPGRDFETQDQVMYKTSSYVSQKSAPFLTLQWKDEDFWRLVVAVKTTDYQATAVKDVGGTSTLRLQHEFISALLQKAYSPLPRWRPFYVGFGAEVAKAFKVKLTLDEIPLETSGQEHPFYFGMQGFTGVQFFILSRWSLALEARAALIPNQAPMITQLEAAGCLLYWW